MTTVIGHVERLGRPRVAIFAHMDEVGLMISRMLPDGKLKFLPVGGVVETKLVDQQVVVLGTKSAITGVIKQRNQANNGTPLCEMYIETELSHDQLCEAGVAVGTPVNYHAPIRMSGTEMTGKALDNRVGCAMLVEIAQRVHEPAYTVDFVGTVREEYGYVGVQVASVDLCPDLAIVLDVTFANDQSPPEHESVIALGKGPAITMRDGGMIGYHRYIGRIIALAKSLHLDYQIEVVEYGASEASRSQLADGGVPSVGIFVPARNNHTASEVVDTNDISTTVKLMVEILNGQISLFD